MSAPYTIVSKYNEPLVKLDKAEIIDVACTVAIAYRRSGICKDARIHGDNIDEGCSDGLDQAERETIEEAGL